MISQLFECGLCGELTPLIRKSSQLKDGVVHEYAECIHCFGQTTILYTNKKIRGLLIKQSSTPPGNMKVKLAERINKEMSLLRKEMEEEV